MASVSLFVNSEVDTILGDDFSTAFNSILSCEKLYINVNTSDISNLIEVPSLRELKILLTECASYLGQIDVIIQADQTDIIECFLETAKLNSIKIIHEYTEDEGMYEDAEEHPNPEIYVAYDVLMDMMIFRNCIPKGGKLPRLLRQCYIDLELGDPFEINDSDIVILSAGMENGDYYVEVSNCPFLETVETEGLEVVINGELPSLRYLICDSAAGDLQPELILFGGEIQGIKGSIIDGAKKLKMVYSKDITQKELDSIGSKAKLIKIPSEHSYIDYVKN